ncbi:MAG: hypothetical protein O2807_01720 [bacterium]|nr:hypothetical protein [bacterium]
MISLFAKFPAVLEFWVVVAVFGFFFLAIQLAFVVPWLMAHLLFWGKRPKNRGFLEVTDRLAEVGKGNVSALVILAVGTLIAIAGGRTEEVIISVMLLFPVGAAGFAAFFFYVLLIFALGKMRTEKKGQRDVRFAAALAAGLCAVAVSGGFAAISFVVERPSLWPSLRGDALSVLFAHEWLARLVSLWLSSLVSGGIVLMILGRLVFRWTAGGSFDSAARVIRHGAFFSLCPFLLLMILSPWLIQGWFEMGLWSANEKWPLIFILTSGAASLVLIEVLFSIIQRRGNISRAVVLAAGMFVGALLLFTAARLAVSGNTPGAAVSAIAPKSAAVWPRAIISGSVRREKGLRLDS